MTRPLQSLLLLLILAIASSGCAYKRYRDADPPQISVASISLAGISMFEQKFSVNLRLRNPNDFDLPVTGMEYRLRLDGVDFASGVSPREIVLPAYGEQVVNVAVYSNVLNSLAKLQKWVDRKPQESAVVPYEVLGHLKLRKMPIRIPFRYAGQFDLAQLSPERLEAIELNIRER